MLIKNAGFTTKALVFSALLLQAGSSVAAGNLATIQGDARVYWQTNIEYSAVQVSVSGGDVIYQNAYGAGQTPVVGVSLPDGTYTYELVFSPVLDEGTQKAMQQARQNGDDSFEKSLKAAGVRTGADNIESGYFTINDGSRVIEGEKEL